MIVLWKISLTRYFFSFSCLEPRTFQMFSKLFSTQDNVLLKSVTLNSLHFPMNSNQVLVMSNSCLKLNLPHFRK